MPRHRSKAPPAYCHQKSSGQAYVRIWIGNQQKQVYLGRHGTEDSRQEYRRILAELETNPTAVYAAAPPGHDLLVNELLVAFLEHAETYYRRADGTHSSEPHNFKLALRPLKDLYGLLPAREFGPKALKAVREQMIRKGWCRKQVNARVNRIRAVFKWAASEELIPATVYEALRTVVGLRPGRSAAVERDPVRPVAEDVVEQTLPFLNRQVAGLVRFQLLTGCRPGEACTVRRSVIDTGGAVWLYRPLEHKTKHRDKTRVIAIGPRAQALLREFFAADIEAYLFSPRRAVEELRAQRAADRVTPRWPSHERANAAKRAESPGRPPAERYTVKSYCYAVRRAAAKAGVSHWHPNQLRHTFATKVRKRRGLEAAGAALGHTKMSATEVYAERDEDLAVEVAALIG